MTRGNGGEDAGERYFWGGYGGRVDHSCAPGPTRPAVNELDWPVGRLVTTPYLEFGFVSFLC